MSARKLSEKQKNELREIAKSCHDVLIETEQRIDKYRDLETSPDTIHKTVKKAWKRLKWEPDEIHKLRNRISSNINLLNAFSLGITRNDVSQLKQYKEDEEREKILNWLSKLNYASEQVANINQRQAGSGEWLLKSSEFQKWVEMPQQTLFCYGIPGAGKTVLASIMIDEVHARFKHDTHVGFAYIYFDLTRQRDQTLQDVLSSLLRQLAQKQPSLAFKMQEMFLDEYKRGTKLLLDEILSGLCYAVGQFQKVYIIIDALDECRSSSGPRDRLLAKIFDLQAKYDLSFLVTSRPIPEIQELFKGKPFVEIRASTPDVQSYMKGRLMELPKFVARNAELQELIITEITKAIDGM